MSWIKRFLKNKWVLRSAMDRERRRLTQDNISLNMKVGALSQQVALDEKTINALQRDKERLVKRLNEVTEKLHVIPPDGASYAETILRFIKFSVWRDQMEKETYGRIIFPYPYDFMMEKQTNVVNYMTLPFATNMYESQSYPSDNIEQASFRGEKIYTALSSDQPTRLLVPCSGPWDKIKLPFEKIADSIKKELRDVG